MSRIAKKSMSSTVLLIVLGVIAIFAGMKSLVLLIPIAVAIWYGAGTELSGGSMRN